MNQQMVRDRTLLIFNLEPIWISVHNQASPLCNHCLPDCEATTYSVVTSSANIRWTHNSQSKVENQAVWLLQPEPEPIVQSDQPEVMKTATSSQSLPVGVLPRVGLTFFIRTTKAVCLPTSGQTTKHNLVQESDGALGSNAEEVQYIREERTGTVDGKEEGQPQNVIRFVLNVHMCPMFQELDSTYNALEKDIAVLNLYFGASTVQGIWRRKCMKMNSSLEYEKSERMTWVDFISNLGGCFGLCLGFSIVSFVEIIYWFSIVLCQNISKS